jgi:hypothetical protein
MAGSPGAFTGTASSGPPVSTFPVKRKDIRKDIQSGNSDDYSRSDEDSLYHAPRVPLIIFLGFSWMPTSPFAAPPCLSCRGAAEESAFAFVMRWDAGEVRLMYSYQL